MNLDIQKANTWKRISAWLFDAILLGIAAVLFGLILSAAVGYDRQNAAMDAHYADYEARYGVSLTISEGDYQAMSPEAQAKYHQAMEAFSRDNDVLYTYNLLINLTLVVTGIGILLAFLALEFAVPLVFGNGQTLGKKIFGVALMRTDCVKINAVSLFIRTLLGKYTIETMIPVMLLFMMFMGTIGIVGPLVLLAIGLTQIILYAATSTNSLIHDSLANTVAVDMASQMIFDTQEQMIEYKKKLHAERVSRQVY